MAVYNAWVVEYLNGSTWTAISNVQDLSCQVGRQTAVDQWPASQASMRIWYPNGYTTPLANLTIGTYIRFFAPGRSSTKPSWTGLVKNVTVEVGIPWNSGTSTGNGDFLVIDCEGGIAVAGRLNDVYYVAASASITALIVQLNSYGVPFGYDTTDPDPPWTFRPAFRQTQSGTEWLQQLAIYGQRRIVDGIRKTWSWAGSVGNTDAPAGYSARSAIYPTIATVGFSDTTNNATNRSYDEVIFDGLADTYFNQASLTYYNSYTSSDDTVTAQTGAGPYRTYVVTGLPLTSNPVDPLASSQQYRATSLTEYLANQFTPADIGISSISATTANQHTQNLDTLGVTDLELGYLPLYVVPVTLRGTTYYCQIEGVAITADTNQTRFTYYVTPTDTTAWFTLDSSTFGVLDQNRLGIY